MLTQNMVVGLPRFVPLDRLCEGCVSKKHN